MITPPSFDQLTYDDLAGCQALVDSLGIPELSDLFNQFADLLTAITDLANALNSQIAEILYKIHALQEMTRNLLSAASLAIRQLSTLGGILPNNPIDKNIANFTAQTNAVTQSERQGEKGV